MNEINIKEKPSSRSLFGLNWMIFCLSDVRPGIGPFLSVFLKSKLNWSSDLVGMALGTMDLTAAISQIPSGLIVDSVKYKRSLILFSCLAICVGSLLILNFPFFSTVILAQSMIGIAAAIMPPTIAAITLGLVKTSQFQKRISINETWSHSGNVATAAVVGFLAYLLGVEWILYLVIVFAIASAFFVTFINPKEIDNAAARALSENKDGAKQAPVPVFAFLKNSYLLVFAFLFFYFILRMQLNYHSSASSCHKKIQQLPPLLWVHASF